MSALLREAIESLNLQPGQSYRTTVDEYEVEVHRMDHVQQAKPPLQDELTDFTEGEMLEPWFTIPDPLVVRRVTAKPTQLPLPDPPVIPDDDESLE